MERSPTMKPCITLIDTVSVFLLLAAALLLGERVTLTVMK